MDSPDLGSTKVAFRPRPFCICGAPLGADLRVRTVSRAWVDLRFLECSACGSWCQSPQLDPDSLAAWYDSDGYQGSATQMGEAYEDYEADEPHRRVEAATRFKHDIARFIRRKPAKILEIGCASASLLSVVRNLGHAVSGVDLSTRFAEQASRLNRIDVEVGNFLEIPYPERTFDAVLLFGTVANLPDLGRVFAKIRDILREEGCVILNFPDARSLPSRAYGRRFWMFSPSVVTFPSVKGIADCAKANGLSVLRIASDWQMPSLIKFARHSGLSPMLPRSLKRALASSAVPFRVPVPSVKIAWLGLKPGTP